MLSAWQFESRAYLYFDILKSFLTLLCFSDFFFQHKASLTAILYLGDLAVLSLFLMAWQWQPAIQLTFFRLLCRGSHRVLPCEQRPFVSIFRRAPSRRVAISLLGCLAVDNRVTCRLCCMSYSLPSLLVLFSARPKRFGSRGPFVLDIPGPEAWNFMSELTITFSYSAQNLFQKLLNTVLLLTSCLSSKRSLSFPESSFAKDFVRLFESRVSTSWTPWTVSVH